MSEHAQARVSAVSDDPLSRFIAVLRRYIPLLHPSLTGPVSEFPQLVDRLWTSATQANLNTMFIEEKRLVLRGIASHVTGQALWTLHDVKQFLHPACGLHFFSPDVLLVLDSETLQVNPIEAGSRLEISECLWLISAILRTASSGYPILESPPEGLVDWVPYRPSETPYLRSAITRNANLLAHNSCFFRQDMNPNDRVRVFHRRIEPAELVGEVSQDSLHTSLDRMMQYADVGTGKDTVRTRLAFFISKVMAFWNVGDAVSLINCVCPPFLDCFSFSLCLRLMFSPMW
jgi:hypothetical protein